MPGTGSLVVSLAETQGYLWDCCTIQCKHQVGRAKNLFEFSVQSTELKIILRALVDMKFGKICHSFTYPWVSLLLSMSLSFGKLQIGQLNIPLLRAANWKQTVAIDWTVCVIHVDVFLDIQLTGIEMFLEPALPTQIATPDD